MRNYKFLIRVILSLALLFIISFHGIVSSNASEGIKELYEKAQVLEVHNLGSRVHGRFGWPKFFPRTTYYG